VNAVGLSFRCVHVEQDGALQRSDFH
jgi:hypothetical protein